MVVTVDVFGHAVNYVKQTFNFAFWNDLEEIKSIPTSETFYCSSMKDDSRQTLLNGWKKAIKAAKIIEYGANPAEIARLCYESKPKPMVLLQANSLINAKFELNNKIAYVCLKNSDLEKFGATNDHTEGIVEALRQINTTEISFVLKEIDENTTKASLRSKKTDVSKIATIFGGGGHTFAAGCTIKKPLEIACNKMLEEIKKVL